MLLEFVVVRILPPRVVHGHTGFPVATRVAFRGNILFRRICVSSVASSEPIIPDRIGMLVRRRYDFACGLLWRHIRSRAMSNQITSREVAIMR